MRIPVWLLDVANLGQPSRSHPRSASSDQKAHTSNAESSLSSPQPEGTDEDIHRLAREPEPNSIQHYLYVLSHG